MTGNRKSDNNLAEHLQAVLPYIEQVKELCQVPSISLGVLHNGERFCYSIGHRDPELAHKADTDTIYMLGSCSKMLTSAAMGILVESKKVHWQDPVKKFLPGFCPVNDPQIGRSADFIDFLRHSTGLADASRLCLGKGGSVLVDEPDLLPLLNLMPSSDEKGQRFNREWAYNNLAYGIVAQAIEQISGQRFEIFVKEQILGPLGMNRTALTKAESETDNNTATPCVTLKNGQFSRIGFQGWPCEHVSPILAAAGIESSVNDMLTWCQAVLAAEREELFRLREPSNSDEAWFSKGVHIQNNPLRQMNRIRRGYWTRPADDPSKHKDAAYCMGWVRMDLPSSMLGAFSGNMMSREEAIRTHLKPEFILGKASQERLAIGHSGGMPGSLATIWTFPETESAVVVLTNGRGLGDASDFVAQIIIQRLFDMKPEVDLISWARQEVKLAESYYRERLFNPWTQARDQENPMRNPNLYSGKYVGFQGLFNLHVEIEEYDQLFVAFNGRRGSKMRLLPFGPHIYSYFIPDYDGWISTGIAVSNFEQTLLEFDFREDKGKVMGLRWLWNAEEERGYFQKSL